MKKGFTLIELLIVVAIIAILAAIAIPNMLEANIRSKVSRSKADLRSVVTAIETYCVDHNHYPTYHYSNTGSSWLEFHIGGRVPDFSMPDPDWRGRNPLTTPIAYITRMPDDPFSRQKAAEPKEIHEYLYVNWPYAVQQVTNQSIKDMFMDANNKYGAYRLHSKGPDGFGPDSGIPYDATNGTVSKGDITYGPKTGFDRFVPF